MLIIFVIFIQSFSYLYVWSYTGRKDTSNGEGVYIGASKQFWIDNFTGPDRSSRNTIANNIIGPYVVSESVDIKESVDKRRRFFSKIIKCYFFEIVFLKITYYLFIYYLKPFYKIRKLPFAKIYNMESMNY